MCKLWLALFDPVVNTMGANPSQTCLAQYKAG